jgi:hypothetical protein
MAVIPKDRDEPGVCPFIFNALKLAMALPGVSYTKSLMTRT